VTPGTVAYISPEAILGQPLSPAADLYSAGVMLYWGITAQHPFDGEPQEVLKAHLETTPPEPSSVREGRISHVLDRVAMRLLQKDPTKRYPDAISVLTELSKLTTIEY
jgi:eukaryotic-like serine/threonine-protein kinase